MLPDQTSDMTMSWWLERNSLMMSIAFLLMVPLSAKNIRGTTATKGFSETVVCFAVDVAVQISRDAIMAYQGQVCCAGSRTFVQEDIYDEFVKRAVKAVETRVIEDVMTTTCEHGPQVINYYLKTCALRQSVEISKECGSLKVTAVS